jgi:uracil-DNA glycosylase family 4
VAGVEAERARRRLRLLCESDRLLGLKDWPVSGVGGVVSDAAPSGGTGGDDIPPAVRDRLVALLEQFPPELEPPGADPKNRPDRMYSARHALKGSPAEAVKAKAQALAELASQTRQCERCGLYKTCRQKVFGIGHPDTRIVFVGEAPGADEDRLGYPFVGRAGRLLTAMVEKGMGLRREHVYICNVLKCRPPENRTPTTDEIAACQDHMWAQLRVIEPEVVVALGLPAMQALLNTTDPIGRRRGRFYEIHLSGSDLMGGPVAKCMPTYHPAYLLRNPADKKKAWEDLKKVMAELGIEVRG